MSGSLVGLIGCFTPDFKTIADFRRDTAEAKATRLKGGIEGLRRQMQSLKEMV